MTEYDISRKSRPILIADYDPRWVEEFRQLATRIRGVAGNLALRIDHIGSTSVPGLAAKDVIDIQITVPDLNQAGGLTDLLRFAGFRRGLELAFDLFDAIPEKDRELEKLYMREPEGDRRAHIHIR